MPMKTTALYSWLSLVLLMMTIPTVVQAQFVYTTNSGAITITGYTGTATTLTIPSVTNGYPVTSIGDWAFSYCTSLTNITIPNSVTRIGDWAFYYCSSLTNITIPNSVTSIGDRAFDNCTRLTNITIPNSVTSIGWDAFSGCTSLTNITIPNSVTNIGDSAFYYCFSLTAISVDTNNSAYSSVDGVLFNKNQTTIIQYPPRKGGTVYTIPISVTSVGSSSLYNCTNLTTITIPNSVTSIGSWAFSYCTSLTSITIPNSVTSIGDYAFYQCTKLKSVYCQGNAPSVYGSAVFSGDNNATVYYLFGATGWASTFGGRPTVLWNPHVQSSGASFGVRTNRFGFTIAGSTKLVIVVEACSNLLSHAWTPVSTNTLTNGSSYFSDPQWTNYPARFYRLRSP